MTKLYLLLLAAALAIFGVLTLAGVSHATEGDPHKSYVCKYVGQPGVDETLQTGQNPIWVDNAAIAEDPVVEGSYFNDAQGRSYVLVANTDKLDPEPSAADCPGGSPSPTPTPTPTPSPSESPSPTTSPTTPPPTTTSPPAPSSGTSTPTTRTPFTHTPSRAIPSVPRTAFTGTSRALLVALGLCLLLTVLGLAMRRIAR